MPCRDPEPCHCVDKCISCGIRKNADAATRAACDMRTILRRHNLEQDLCSETRRWIAKHDKDDKERIAVENANGLRAKAKQRGLNKLTLEERRALGL